MLRRSLILLFILTINQLKAEKLFDQQDYNASLNDAPIHEVDSLNLLSKKFKIFNKDSSLYFAQQALQIASSIEYIEGVIHAQHNIGEFYLDDGDYDSALEVFKAAELVPANHPPHRAIRVEAGHRYAQGRGQAVVEGRDRGGEGTR